MTKPAPFAPHKMHEAGHQFRSREKDWLAEHQDTHLTLTQICNRTSIGLSRLKNTLPPPDLICPHGARTRLWETAKLRAAGWL